jgi:hypothetical protein
MIVRREKNGGALVAGQTDHSRLAGQFAAHWGNARFAPVEPYESVVRMAHFHDYGHLRYETSPIFDPKTGETPGFREVPKSAKLLEEYEWCYDWLLAPDPYAATLASMHRTGLSRRRYDAIVHPKQELRALPPDLEEFVARNEAKRAQHIAGFDWNPDRLRINYRLMQVWDLLSLYFSCQEPYEEYIEPVPTSYRDKEGEGVRLTLTPIGPNRVALDPYPFDVDACKFQLAGRRLSPAKSESRDEFVRAYFQAPIEVIEFELCAPPTGGRSDARLATASAR